ncbi:hypothetical protein MLW75_07245 [Escherichia coli]|nr:hypothetical protein [Escherichia coli]
MKYNNVIFLGLCLGLTTYSALSASALGYRSPREYLRQWASDGLSDNRCLEI